MHAVVAANVGGSGKHTVVSSVSATEGGQMSEDERSEQVTDDELAEQEAEELPERTQMSVLKMPGDTLPVLPPEID